MAKDFKVVGDDQLRTVKATVASATVIEAGDLVDLTSGLVTKADASSTELAYAPNGSADGETVMDISVGDEFILEGTGDAVFAVTQKGTTVDLVMDGDDQQIDVGTSSTNVLKIDVSQDAGTVDSADSIRVKINKPVL